MYIPSVPDTPTNQPSKIARKDRACLRCRTKFHSEWAGERICPHCKNSSTWRKGAPLGTVSSLKRP